MNTAPRVPFFGPVFRCEPAAFPDEAARWITGVIVDTIRLRGECAVALAGGATPRPVYECMARPHLAQRVEWNRVVVCFSDERGVQVDDPENNYRMANDALLRHVPIPSASIHRMQAERVDLDAAASDYEHILPARLDLILLGMGTDGHTASLFPRSPALAEHTRRVIPVKGPENSPWRMTITPPVIHDAATLIVLVAGADKATAVAKALEGAYAPDMLPIQLATRGTWFIDHAAARGLHGTPT